MRRKLEHIQLLPESNRLKVASKSTDKDIDLKEEYREREQNY